MGSLIPPMNLPPATNYTQSLLAPRIAPGSQITVRRVVPYIPPPRTNVTIGPARVRVNLDLDFSDDPVSTVLSRTELQTASK